MSWIDAIRATLKTTSSDVPSVVMFLALPIIIGIAAIIFASTNVFVMFVYWILFITIPAIFGGMTTFIFIKEVRQMKNKPIVKTI